MYQRGLTPLTDRTLYDNVFGEAVTEPLATPFGVTPTADPQSRLVSEMPGQLAVPARCAGITCKR